MDTPLISIVIPVYGVEKYIEQCARSLFEQTYPNIEYIFVNDCTQDSSMGVLFSVLADYPHREHLVKVIQHEENKGLAKTRYDGFLAAKGDYITSCDSDDWLDVKACELLVNKAESDNADIVVYGYHHYYSETKIINYSIFNHSSSDLLSDLFLGRLNPCIHTCIFKRFFIDNDLIHAPAADMAEDLVFTVQLFYNAERISFLNQSLYYYRQNEKSISHSIDEKAYFSRCEGLYKNTEQIIAYLRDRHIEDKYQHEIVHLKHVVKTMIMPVLYIPAAFSLWRRLYPEIVPKVIFGGMYSFRTRILYFLTAIGLYPFYHRIKYAEKR